MRSAGPTRTAPADFSIGELVVAYRDCRRTKRYTTAALAFELDLERNLIRLYDQLQDGSYRPGRSTCFVITRPKPREVWAAGYDDRIVHHLMYNRIAPLFLPSFIADSCACIPGRGTLYAAERLEAKVRSITQNWKQPARYLKCDISNFFVSINKPILHGFLRAKIHDPWWLQLTETILFHDPRVDVQIHSPQELLARIPPYKSLFNRDTDHGLPIGNLSSQFFANVYLDAIDQHIKHRIRAKHYIRYVDDFVLLHESAQWLNQAYDEIERFLGIALSLQLNESKTIRQPITRAIDFVGQVVKPWHRVTRRRTFHDALHRVEHMPDNELFAAANSYFGLLHQATHSHGDRAKLARLLRRRGWPIDHRLTKVYRR